MIRNIWKNGLKSFLYLVEFTQQGKNGGSLIYLRQSYSTDKIVSRLSSDVTEWEASLDSETKKRLFEIKVEVPYYIFR